MGKSKFFHLFAAAQVALLGSGVRAFAAEDSATFRSDPPPVPPTQTAPVSLWKPGPVNEQALDRVFQEAKARYGIPVDLLKAIGWVESRGHQEEISEHAFSDGQNISYGYMGLNDDDRTNHTLQEAAFLLGVTENQLKIDVRTNILGAAAVLRHRAMIYLKIDEKKALVKGSMENEEWEAFRVQILNWIPLIQTYSGLKASQKGETADALEPWKLYVGEVLTLLKKGHQPDKNDKFDTLVIHAYPNLKIPHYLTAAEEEADTNPLKIVKRPAARWVFTKNSSFNPRFIVIHDTEGRFPGALQVLRYGDSGGNRSSHYLIRSSDGLVAEIVDPEKGVAWHARGWNQFAIGVEHEARNMNTPGWYTKDMYIASAKLVKQLCETYNIPIDSQHIFGHDYWMSAEYKQSALQKTLVSHHVSQRQSHDDPGPLWRWDLYFQYLKGDDHAFDRLGTPVTKVFHKPARAAKKRKSTKKRSTKKKA